MIGEDRGVGGDVPIAFRACIIVQGSHHWHTFGEMDVLVLVVPSRNRFV